MSHCSGTSGSIRLAEIPDSSAGMHKFKLEHQASLTHTDASDALLKDAQQANISALLDNRSGLQQLGTDCGNWLQNNIVNPAYNSLYVHNRRALGHLTGSQWLTNVEAAEVKTGGALEYCAQHLSSGLAGVIPYAIAGKFVGGVSRALAGSVGLTGLPARVAASETFTQIAGAATLDALRTAPGESRLLNALGGATAFGIFEGGNHLVKGMSFAPRILGRALTGVAGAGTQLGITQGRNLESQQLLEGVQSGAFLNVFLPPVQKVLGAGIDALNHELGRGAPLGRHLNRFDLSGKSKELDAMAADNPLARVQVLKDGDAHINHERNLAAVKNPKDAAELAHELHEAVAFKQSKSQFQQAQELLATNPEQAKQVFLKTCLEIELAARAVETNVGIQSGIKRAIESDPASIAKLYQNQWNNDFQKFHTSNGTELPQLGFSKDNPSGARISEILSDSDGTSGKRTQRHDATEAESKKVESKPKETKSAKIADLTPELAGNLVTTLGMSVGSPDKALHFFTYLKENVAHKDSILKWMSDFETQLKTLNSGEHAAASTPQELAARQRLADNLAHFRPLARNYFALGLHTNPLEAAAHGLSHPRPEIQNQAAVATFLNLDNPKPELRTKAVKTLQENLHKTSAEVQTEIVQRLKPRLESENPEHRNQAIDILIHQLAKTSEANSKVEPVRILGEHLQTLSDAQFAVWSKFAPDAYNCGYKLAEILNHEHVRQLPTSVIKTFLSRQKQDGNSHQEKLPDAGSVADLAAAPAWARKHIEQSRIIRDQVNKERLEAGSPDRLTVNQPWQRRSPGPNDVVERATLMSQVVDAFGPELGTKLIAAGAHNRVVFSDIMDMIKVPDNQPGQGNQRNIDSAKAKAADIKLAFSENPELGIKLLTMGANDRLGLQEVLNAVGHGIPKYRTHSLDLLYSLMINKCDMNTLRYVFRMTREGYTTGAFDIVKQQLGPRMEMTAEQIEDAMMRDNLKNNRFPSYDEVHQAALHEHAERQKDYKQIQESISELSSFNNRPRPPRKEFSGPRNRNDRS